MILPGNQRPWYMVGGQVMPENMKTERIDNHLLKVRKLFPVKNSSGDRIPEQLMFVPSNYHRQKNLHVVKDNNPNIKTILLWNRDYSWNEIPEGSEIFIRENCPVNSCKILIKNQ